MKILKMLIITVCVITFSLSLLYYLSPVQEQNSFVENTYVIATEEQVMERIEDLLEKRGLEVTSDSAFYDNGTTIHTSFPLEENEVSGKVLNIRVIPSKKEPLKNLEIVGLMEICELARSHQLPFKFDGICMYYSRYNGLFVPMPTIQIKFSMKEYKEIYNNTEGSDELYHEEKINKLTRTYVEKYSYDTVNEFVEQGYENFEG